MNALFSAAEAYRHILVHLPDNDLERSHANRHIGSVRSEVEARNQFHHQII